VISGYFYAQIMKMSPKVFYHILFLLKNCISDFFEEYGSVNMSQRFSVESGRHAAAGLTHSIIGQEIVMHAPTG
jgi:hypothetical protein